MAGEFLELRCASFASQDEFREYGRQHSRALADRAEYERSLGSSRAELCLNGTCGVCLRPADFISATAGGEFAAAGRVPLWRTGSRCDCASGLVALERATLQFVLGNVGVQRWQRVLLIGGAGRLSAALGIFAASVDDAWPLDPAADVRPASYHLAVSLDVLQLGASPPALLGQAARALVPGGRLVFSVPFAADRDRTDPAPAPGGAHRIGWDILRHATDAGFRTATAHLFWSGEFGYLGDSNFLFLAAR